MDQVNNKELDLQSQLLAIQSESSNPNIIKPKVDKNQSQAIVLNQSTQRRLENYGLNKPKKEVIQKAPNKIILNNTITNTIGNVSGPIQSRELKVNNQGKMKSWLSSVFSKQKEETNNQNLELSKHESLLAKGTNKVLKKLETIGKKVTTALDPKSAQKTQQSQLKSLFITLGLGALATTMPKILNFISNLENNVRSAIESIKSGIQNVFNISDLSISFASSLHNASRTGVLDEVIKNIREEFRHRVAMAELVPKAKDGNFIENILDNFINKFAVIVGGSDIVRDAIIREPNRQIAEILSGPAGKTDYSRVNPYDKINNPVYITKWNKKLEKDDDDNNYKGRGFYVRADLTEDSNAKDILLGNGGLNDGKHDQVWQEELRKAGFYIEGEGDLWSGSNQSTLTNLRLSKYDINDWDGSLSRTWHAPICCSYTCSVRGINNRNGAIIGSIDPNLFTWCIIELCSWKSNTSTYSGYVPVNSVFYKLVIGLGKTVNFTFKDSKVGTFVLVREPMTIKAKNFYYPHGKIPITEYLIMVPKEDVSGRERPKGNGFEVEKRVNLINQEELKRFYQTLVGTNSNHPKDWLNLDNQSVLTGSSFSGENFNVNFVIEDKGKKINEIVTDISDKLTSISQYEDEHGYLITRNAEDDIWQGGNTNTGSFISNIFNPDDNDNSQQVIFEYTGQGTPANDIVNKISAAAAKGDYVAYGEDDTNNAGRHFAGTKYEGKEHEYITKNLWVDYLTGKRRGVNDYHGECVTGPAYWYKVAGISAPAYVWGTNSSGLPEIVLSEASKKQNWKIIWRGTKEDVKSLNKKLLRTGDYIVNRGGDWNAKRKEATKYHGSMVWYDSNGKFHVLSDTDQGELIWVYGSCPNFKPNPKTSVVIIRKMDLWTDSKKDQSPIVGGGSTQSSVTPAVHHRITPTLDYKTYPDEDYYNLGVDQTDIPLLREQGIEPTFEAINAWKREQKFGGGGSSFTESLGSTISDSDISPNQDDMESYYSINKTASESIILTNLDILALLDDTNQVLREMAVDLASENTTSNLNVDFIETTKQIT